MSESWLQSWLNNLNLSEYHQTLAKCGYASPESLAFIVDRDQLKAIGVTKMGHLSRLFRAIEKLRGDAGGGSDTSHRGDAGGESDTIHKLSTSSLPPEISTSVSLPPENSSSSQDSILKGETSQSAVE